MHKIEVRDAVTRASSRSAALVHCEMKQGLDSLASIAVTAPFVGMFGTAIGIIYAFGVASGEMAVPLGAIGRGIADALVPTAISIVIALMASCGHKYLQAQLNEFDREMQSTSLQLADLLAHLTHR